MGEYSDIKYGLILLGLISASIYLAVYTGQESSSELSQFQMWKQKHSISYASSFENSYREKVFYQNKIIVDKHNMNPKRSYSKGINKFSALTKQEFRQTYLTLQSQRNGVINTPQTNEQIADLELTGDIDWRKQGAVGPVKDQGHCGGCWAFSATGGIQGVSKIFYGSLQIFSEQQLIDCVTGNNGCHGGQMRRALDYVKQNGIVELSQYPYKAVQGACQIPKGNFKISGYTNVTGCTQLANALTSRPITVGVDADGWDDYQSGVYDNCPKQKGQFNHGVLVVGMTSDAWIIKNQWTTQWGEDGYMRLKKGDTCNVCDDGMLVNK